MLLNILSSNSSNEVAKTTLYHIKSAIPGRIRWHIRGLKNSTYQQKVKKFLESLKGVTNVRINSIAESIIVNFSEKKLSSTDLQEKFEQAIAQITSVEPYSLPSRKNGETDDRKKTVKQKKAISEAATESSLTQSVEEKPNNLSESSAKKSSSSAPSTPQKEAIEKTTISEKETKTLSEQEITSPHSDAWLSQCQEQAKIIEQLEQQLGQLLSKSSIGANLLHKGDIYKSNQIKPEHSSTPPTDLLSLETLEKQGNWQELAQRQTEKIAQLQQEISEQQRLSAIADFHLNKWRYRFFQ